MAKKDTIAKKVRKAVCVYMHRLQPLSDEEKEELWARISMAISQAPKA